MLAMRVGTAPESISLWIVYSSARELDMMFLREIAALS